jgi:hypothetical protein
MAWASTLVDALERPNSLDAIMALPRDTQRIDSFDVDLVFESAPPTGWVAEHLVLVDRGFRLGTRVAEADLSPIAFMQNRHRRGIPVADGMVVGAFEPGSLRVSLKPSKRILKSAAKGFVVIGTSISYLNGAFDFVDHVTDHEPHSAPVYYIQQAPKPQPALEIRIRRDDEGVDITLKATGERYQLDAAKPIQQLGP